MNIKSLLVFILVAFSACIQAQEAVKIQGTLFAPPADGRPVLEIWQQPKWDEKIGRPAMMAVNNNSEVIVWSENWHLVVLDQQGKILALKQNTPSCIATTRDDFIYGLFPVYENNKYRDIVLKFDSRGRLQETINLNGIDAHHNGRMLISSNNEFVFVDPVYQDAYYYTTRIYRYDSNGQFISSWDLREKAPEIIDQLRSFIITTDDLLACLYNRDDKIYIFDLNGNVVRSFAYDLAENDYPPFDIYLNNKNQIVAYEAFTRYLQVFKTNGKTVKQFSLVNSPNPQISGHKLCFDAAGNIYLHEFEPETISRFSPQGEFEKIVVNTNKLTTPAALYEDRGPFSNKLLTRADDGTIYGLDSTFESVNILSAQGNVLGSFKIPRQKYDPVEMNMTPDGNLAILYYNRLVFFSTKGKLLDIWKDFADPGGFTIAPNGNIYIATRTYRDSRLVCFRKNGKKKYSKLKYGEEEENFRYPSAIAYGPDGNLHILDNLATTKIYSKSGKFIRSVSLPTAYEKLSFDREGNYLLLASNHFAVTNTEGNLLDYHLHPLFDDLDDIISDAAGAYIATNRSGHRLIRFNPSKVLIPRGTKTEILGTLKYTSEPGPSYAPSLPVYLEATDKKGRKFFAFSSISNGGNYQFYNVPLKSKYKIWCDDPHLVISKLKKPLLTGTLNKAAVKNFRTASIPSGLVRIYGIAKTLAGIPINGVTISSGKYKAISGVDGRFLLHLPGNQAHTITASKEGYSFRNNGRKVILSLQDKLFVNFTSK